MKKTREEQLPLAGTEEGEILSKLADRVERAIATIQALRKERDSLKTKLAALENEARTKADAGERLSALEEEHTRFQRERDEIRNRIETLLSNLESLDEGAE